MMRAMNAPKPFTAPLIHQSWIAAAAMMAMIALSLFDPLHDPLTQHMSELAKGSPWAAVAVRILPAITGLSILAFGLGCLAHRAHWTGVSGALFGAAMLANGVFPADNPLHGLYGLAIFSVLVPVCYAAELNPPPALRQLSFAASFAALIYMWGLLAGLEPEAFRGVTQRVFSLVAFGWFLVPALERKRASRRIKRAGAYFR